METIGVTVWNVENIEEFDVFHDAPRYRKKVSTEAVRMKGAFKVETSEGMLECKDGYLCKDARGYPYPVAKEEFDLIYRPDTEDA
jgi:hypothetical protein